MKVVFPLLLFISFGLYAQETHFINEIQKTPGSVSVEFDPVQIAQVLVEEAYAAGSIVSIDVHDSKGRHEIYRNHSSYHSEGRRVLLVRCYYPELVSRITIHYKQENGLEGSQFKSIGYSTIDALNTIQQLSSNGYDSVMFEFPVPKPLRLSFNSEYNEIKPIVTPDHEQLYFVREQHPDNLGGVNDLQDIYRSSLSSGWSSAENVGRPLNNKDANGICAVSPAGNIIYMINNYGAGKGLAYSTRSKDGYDLPLNVPIDKFSNKNEFVDFFVHPNGEVMLMAVETESSQGDQDLYVSFNKLGIWSEPLNLGPMVNTPLAEYAPFLSADLRFLFFSSYGHHGYGKGDIYVSRRIGEGWSSWTQPINLGSQINTSESDAYFTLSADGISAFYSTKTSGGSYDIYSFELPEDARPEPAIILKGHVLDSINGNPIKGTIFYESVENLDYKGQMHSEPSTGSFQGVWFANNTYKWWGIAEGYIGKSDIVYVPDSLGGTTVDGKVQMVPIEVGQVYTLKEVFFELGTANILQESKHELTRWVYTLKENPGVKIEVQGHTDYAGNADRNTALSFKRAEVVKEFLVESGVDDRQVSIHGYGGSRPVVESEVVDERINNRRVDIAVTDYSPSKKK